MLAAVLAALLTVDTVLLAREEREIDDRKEEAKESEAVRFRLVRIFF